MCVRAWKKASLFAVQALAVLLTSSAIAPSPFTDCPGCAGSNSTSFVACPQGGGVGITVTVTPGKCKLQQVVPDGPIQCRQKDPCLVTIHRVWSGLMTDSAMTFCWEVTPAGRHGCIDQPPPSSGSTGEGEDTNGPYGLSCGQPPITYSIQGDCAGNASVSASGQGACGACLD